MRQLPRVSAISDDRCILFLSSSGSADIAKVTALWHAIPSQLAKENKKIVYSDMAAWQAASLKK